ncbi:hypothetical protein PG994_003055 [Apiospora phragmitis]|uniref:Presequence protease, mitochondrial n=1 Tax=Apiospora phragmitis TaxID=2905665 RepID=A0ABR1WAR2_9PEZI
MLRNAANAAKGAAKKAVTELSTYPKPGEKLHGFTLLRTKHVPELELTALHLQHDKTGADYLHIARDDSNNVFSIGFKTNPPDDTGVPHILEHTTLCGSEKYPIRDPFFKMLPRTLSNFMNAMTASDHTYYPFATTNAQDFQNLMSGWRIGPENPRVAEKEGEAKPEDNEMFPAINNSGGDPQKITDLTYEQLKKFHADHYHPSNAKVLTYGDMPLADHLKEIKADTENHTPIDLSNGPKEVTVLGPIDPLADQDKQYKTSISWTTGDTGDVVESFSLSMLSSLLMDGYGSPLYKGLIESGLGTDFSPNAGYDSHGRVGIFSVGLTGVQKEDVAKLKDEVQKVYAEVRQNGFERAKIDGYLHQLELALKHKTANFGLGIVQRIQSKWFTGVDPFDSLAWNTIIEAFEANMAKGNYLEGLMDKYFMNDNTLTFTMAPSETYSKDLVVEEEERLANKIKEATARAGGEAEVHKYLEKRELELLAEQGKSTTEDLSVLPTVYVKDIPRERERIEVRDETAHGTTIQWREAPTNGLTYFRAINTFDGLPDELRALLPLFTDAIMRLGTKDMTMEQLEDLIKLKTGGISVGYSSTASPYDFHQAIEGIALRGMALDRHVPDMFNLLQKLILETNFDSPEAAKQIRQLLEAASDGVVNDIASSGHSYAMRAAESGLTREAWLSEQDVIGKLKQIQQFALAGSNIRTALTCGPESVSDNSSALSKFMSTRPSSSVNFGKSPATPVGRDIKAFYPLPYQVYYGSLVLPTVSYTHADGAPLQILSQLLTHKHLHHEIREKGGAYGGGAYMKGLDGIFGMYSYRDPNPQNTLSIMQGAGRWAVDKQFKDQDLEEAKISVFKSVDAPRSVSTEGMDRFVSGITEEMKQARRTQMLDVTKNQVREVAQKYIVDALAKQQERVAFLGEKKDWVDGAWKINEMNGVGSSE